MAFQGGAHGNATGVFTDEAATIIAAQIASQISAWGAQFMNLERRTRAAEREDGRAVEQDRRDREQA